MSVTAVSDLIKSGQAEIGFLADFVVAKEPELKEEYKKTPQTSQDNVKQIISCYQCCHLCLCVFIIDKSPSILTARFLQIGPSYEQEKVYV